MLLQEGAWVVTFLPTNKAGILEQVSKLSPFCSFSLSFSFSLSCAEMRILVAVEGLGAIE